MSTPVSIHDGPFTTNTLVSKKFLVIYIFIIWISVLPFLIEVYIFWTLMDDNLSLLILVLPFQIYIGYITVVLSSILTSKLLLIIINSIHKPKEGFFSRSRKDKDYYFWSLRGVIKKWPVLISKFLPIPLVNKLNLRWFHNDSEFIEFGKHITIGKGSSIKASIILGNYLIIKKTKIQDNVIIGSNSFISPGTQVCKNSVIETMSITRFDQYIKPGSIYRSFPEMGYKEYEFDSTHSIQDIEESIFKNSINTQRKKNDEKILRDSKFNEEKFIKNINFNLSIFGIIFFISNAIPILGIIYFGSEFFIPYILKSPTIFYIFKNLASLIIFLITPFIIIILYVINLLVLIIITKLIYNLIQNSNPFKEGVFHWQCKNLDFKNYFKRSFLLRYLKWKIQRNFFPWLTIPAFNFVKNCCIGKNTVIEDSYLAKELLEIGNNVYIGKCLLANHLWDKNLTIKKIYVGDNVTISDNCCIAPGTEIEEKISILPLSITAKCAKLTSSSYYHHSPLMKISHEEVTKAIKLEIGDIYIKDKS